MFKFVCRTQDGLVQVNCFKANLVFGVRTVTAFVGYTVT